MKDSKIYIKIKYFIILLILGINIAVLVSVFGRYIVDKTTGFFERTKAFFFYSDKLDTDNPYYQIDNWSGVDDYTITITMNSYKNNLLAVDYDINYDVTYECSDNVICQLSPDTHTISSETNSDFFNIVVTPNRTLTDGDTAYVEITATATKPYKKTLKARFTLKVGKEQLTYSIEDVAKRPYLEVNITNTLSYYTVNEAFDEYSVGSQITRDVFLSLTKDKQDKCYSKIINIEFDPTQILLDMTDTAYVSGISNTSTNIDEKVYINSIKFKIDALSSKKVRFYKVDESKDYTYPIINETPVITLTSE